jgi:hypothetical protein
MFKKSALKSAVAAALLGVSGFALAGGTTSLTVNAKILGTCKVTTAPGTLDFGTIDPTGGSNAPASTTFAMKCTNGTTSTAAGDDGGLYNSSGKRMRHTNTTAFLPYSIAYGTGTSSDIGFAGAGFSTGAGSRTVTINGTVTPANYNDALATIGTDVYADTVTITVNP